MHIVIQALGIVSIIIGAIAAALALLDGRSPVPGLAAAVAGALLYVLGQMASDLQIIRERIVESEAPPRRQ
jgi:tetrahydromethanopterin S-methyltransferase subunit C